jgi:hypothetical protein
MAIYSPGELFADFDYITEVTYGVTPATQLIYGCTIHSVKPRVATHTTFHNGSTGRSFSDATRGAWDVGFKLKGYIRTTGGPTWRNFFPVFGLGSTTALTEHLPSFSGQIEFKIGAARVYWMFNGCKIDKLKISCEGPGQILDFEADVIARWVEKTTTKTLAGLQAAVVVGADGATATGGMLTWETASQINIDAGGLVDWHPKSWTLEIDNHLNPSMGCLLGADAEYYHCAQALAEGGRDILFTCNLDLESETYNAAKLVKSVAGDAPASPITSLTIPIGSAIDTITLANGIILLEDDDLPEFKHDVMEQPIRIRFKSLTIA